MEQTKGTRGGRRPGAGRKATGVTQTETITLRVSPAVKIGLRQQANAEGKTIKKLIEDMLSERKAGK